jgi:hypothetical protein
VLAQVPEERRKLLEEMADHELPCFAAETRRAPQQATPQQKCTSTTTIDEEEDTTTTSSTNSSSSSNDDDEIIDDDVFEKTEKKADEVAKEQQKRKMNEDEMELYEAVEKMRYLDMFVRETLRMFPIACSMVSRQQCAATPVTVGGGEYTVPQGMNVVVDVLSIHYDQVLWGPVSPRRFYPDRFLVTRHPAAWLPFGLGGRKCLGSKLAMAHLKLALVRLLQNYRIEKKNKVLDDVNGNEKEEYDDDDDGTCFLPVADTVQTKDVLFASPIDPLNLTLIPLL